MTLAHTCERQSEDVVLQRAQRTGNWRPLPAATERAVDYNEGRQDKCLPSSAFRYRCGLSKPFSGRD